MTVEQDSTGTENRGLSVTSKQVESRNRYISKPRSGVWGCSLEPTAFCSDPQPFSAF